MATNLHKELAGLIKEEAQAMGSTKSARDYVNLLSSELKAQINSSDMPAGVKNALINSISVAVLSPDQAVVTVSAMRPSIFDVLGAPKKFGTVDLALVYDNKSALKSSAKVYSKDPKIFLPIGRIHGFARGYTNNYLQKTAASFMSKFPDCTVTVSR